MSILREANYTAKVKDGIAILQDLGGPGMSLTNYIDKAMGKLSQAQQKHIRFAVYSDSEGVWDAYDVDEDRFINLNAADEEEALEKFYHERAKQ